MSEVYWIAGVEEWQAPGGIDAWLINCGLKSAWIDEIFWLTESRDQKIPDMPDRPRQWPVAGPTSHRLIQLILNDMQCGMNNLVLLAESRGEAVSLAALATPQAVGRYNLLPAARFQALKGLREGQSPADIEKILMSGLAENEMDPGSVILLASFEPKINLANSLPSIKPLVLPEDSGLIDSIIVLLEELKKQSTKAGILLNRTSGTATLLEAL